MVREKFLLGVVQLAMTADSDENLAGAVRGIRAAAARGARVICLPELFRSLYFCQAEDHANFALAEAIPGPSTAALAPLCRELGVAVVASLFERRAAGVYHNTVAVLDADGSLAGTYRKMHIPDDPLYLEKFYFTPGDLGFRAIDTRFARLGTLICWDQWYPEAARLTALQGPEVLVYPTAIGWHPAEKAEYGAAQADAWRTIQRGHAIANGTYVVAVNRVGHERPAGVVGEGIEFFGGSFVCDPFGVMLAEAGRTDPEVLVVEIDPARQETVRQHWPFLRDRRIDAYAPITARFIDER
ncbi:MAG: carbon-nitrogen hydrolase [Myxococcales bacterium]|nr:carbon-nitrogen hydrolase [Myxococcales bacterium]